jgi:hypothetical protein
VQPYGSVGSRDPAMEAVDRSHAVITCISAAYLKNVSYRMEIIYADIKRKEGTILRGNVALFGFYLLVQ